MHKLDNEAEKIYLSIFNRDIPETVKKRFDDISHVINDSFSQYEVKQYYDLVRSARDLEALELATRYLGKMPILTEKFKVMVYLAETIPHNYNVFINEATGQLSAYAAIIFSVGRTILKISKGVIMLIRYRL